jgi:hypothetical protein
MLLQVVLSNAPTPPEQPSLLAAPCAVLSAACIRRKPFSFLAQAFQFFERLSLPEKPTQDHALPIVRGELAARHTAPAERVPGLASPRWSDGDRLA